MKNDTPFTLSSQNRSDPNANFQRNDFGESKRNNHKRSDIGKTLWNTTKFIEIGHQVCVNTQFIEPNSLTLAARITQRTRFGIAEVVRARLFHCGNHNAAFRCIQSKTRHTQLQCIVCKQSYTLYLCTVTMVCFAFQLRRVCMENERKITQNICYICCYAHRMDGIRELIISSVMIPLHRTTSPMNVVFV